MKIKPSRTPFFRLFPSTSVQGYYDPFFQSITLSKYDARDFKNVSLRSPSIDELKRASLYEHELTHWIDHVSTLWVHNNLFMLYNALNARANNKAEDFYLMKALDVKVRRDSYFDFYTEKFDLRDKVIRDPWKWATSIGFRLTESGHYDQNKLILFLTFRSFDDIPLIRIPLSIAAILETNAIYYEYALKLSTINLIKDDAIRIVETQASIRDWRSLLFNPGLTLYTAVAHLTANLASTDNVSLVYKLASSIGTTVLNLPEETITSMRLKIDSDDEWTSRSKLLVKNGDIGFAFYNLLTNLGEFSSYSLEALLKSSDLPKKEDLEQQIMEKMNSNLSHLNSGPFYEIAKNLLTNGLEIFKVRGLDGQNQNSRNRIYDLGLRPQLLFGDTIFDDDGFSVATTLNRLIKNEEISEDELWCIRSFYGSKFNQFVGACGI